MKKTTITKSHQSGKTIAINKRIAALRKAGHIVYIAGQVNPGCIAPGTELNLPYETYYLSPEGLTKL